MKSPNFLLERELLSQGYESIVGVDEAGTGALAGPVVAAAVIFPVDSRLGNVRDSKLLTAKNREYLFKKICERATYFAIGIATVEDIAHMGLRKANYYAMKTAIEQIETADFALIDAWTIPELTIPQQGIIKGDQKIKSIAAASIIAKVTRDNIMERLHVEYPAYGFGKHKGYATKQHREAICLYGACPAHRLSYRTFL